jgi:hypothetical protein
MLIEHPRPELGGVAGTPRNNFSPTRLAQNHQKTEFLFPAKATPDLLSSPPLERGRVRGTSAQDMGTWRGNRYCVLERQTR